MLYLTKCEINNSNEVKLAPNAQLTSAGQPIATSAATPAGFFAPANGIDGEKFAGFALTQPMVAETVVNSLALVVDADKTVTLPRKFEDVSGVTAIKPDGTVIPLVAVNGKPFKASDNATPALVAGTTLTVSFQRPLTVTESRFYQGDEQPGGAASRTLESFGLITKGIVYITDFDHTVNWALSGGQDIGIKNGLVSFGSGVKCLIPNARVVSIPATGGNAAYLGLYFAA